MKTVFRVLFSLFIYQYTFAQNPLFNFNGKIAESEMKAAQGFLNFQEDLATTNYNIVYDKCFWNIDPAVKFISGHVQTYFIPLNTGMTSIVLDLTDSLTVDSVIYNNQQATFTHIDSQIVISFPSTLTIGDEYNVDVYYHGVPETVGFGSFVQQKHGPDSVPTIWTLSEPYGASDWWPCKNSLTDKIDSIDIYVTTPSQYSDASNGLLVSQDSSGGYTTWHWKHRYPIATYLVAIDVTTFYVYTEHVIYNGDTLNVPDYIWPEDSTEDFNEEIPVLTSAMLIYDSLYELYPFSKEKYGHAQFGWGNGGMEHQTMSYMANFNFELVVHELAHQWFGDKVTCGSWQDIFLNEGFAVYSTDICYQELSNNVWWPVWKTEQLSDITSQPDGSVWVDDTTSVARIFDRRLTYDKGGYLLHQLRYQIGDSAFFAGLHSYLDDPKLAYGFARVSDLIAHLSTSSGQDLTGYFNQWYYGQGFPSYQLTWGEDNNNRVNLTINQTTSDPASVSFFPLDVPVEFKNATNDTTIRVANSFSGQNYTLQLPFEVDSVKFDPERWLISAGNTVSGINPKAVPYLINVFPNPVSTNLFINTSDNGFHLSAAALYNAIGQQVYLQTFLQNTNSVDIDTRAFSDGVYMLNLSTDAGAIQRKIIVMR
jgi:aminopeptidase N